MSKQLYVFTKSGSIVRKLPGEHKRIVSRKVILMWVVERVDTGTRMEVPAHACTPVYTVRACNNYQPMGTSEGPRGESVDPVTASCH